MMQDAVISPGPPPLTLSAADGAIDLIDFMAAAVRGVDTIDVTPAMRESWRAYLAQYYPMLPPPDRMWFANASFMLAQIHQGWAQLSEQQRTATVQAWSMILPAILQFAAPVLGQGAAAQPGMMMPGMPRRRRRRTRRRRRRTRRQRLRTRLSLRATTGAASRRRSWSRS